MPTKPSKPSKLSRSTSKSSVKSSDSSKSASSKKSSKSTKSTKKTSTTKSSSKSKKSPNIGNRIKKPALQRLFRRGGVMRVKGEVYDTVRDLLVKYARRLIHAMSVSTSYNDRKTISEGDLRVALNSFGIYLGAAEHPTSNKTVSLRSSNARKKKQKSSEEKEEKEGVKKSEKKKKKVRPGALALRDIIKRQRNSDCLEIPHANFQGLARELASEFYISKEEDNYKTYRFSNKAFLLLQLAVEDYVYKICKHAYLISKRAKGQTLTSVDIELVLDISSDSIKVL